MTIHWFEHQVMQRLRASRLSKPYDNYVIIRRRLRI